MAESKGVMLAKSVQKHAGRAKEKILQNLGKVDRTADEIFDDHLNNFNRQQNSANKLQKEFNNYIRCVRALQGASKSLMDAVCEVYEPNWSGYDALIAQTAASDSLWQDFAHKLGDQVLIPLNTYTGQFPEMKKKVEKRNRKLIDYDGQRHSFQSLQASANKRKDDVKLTKGREQLEEARRTYEILNTELHDELPALFDSRILFLVTNLQTLFASQQVFHNETSKIYSELEAIVDKLATESQRGTHTLKKLTGNAIKAISPVQSPIKQMNNSIANNSNYQNQSQITNGASNANSPTSSPTTSSQPEQSSPRLDSISSTPESPEMQAKHTTSATTTPHVREDAYEDQEEEDNYCEEPSYQNSSSIIAVTSQTALTVVSEAIAEAAATAAALCNEENRENDDIGIATNDNQKLNSPNANSTTTTTTTSISETTGAIRNSTASAAAIVTTDEAMNNVTRSPKPTPVPGISANGQMNGNGNANNGNIAITMSRKKEDDDEDNNKKIIDASSAELPPGVLYRVKATYAYKKEDIDELSFEIGDIIRVIEYDDPEDQEEGWLMGQKEGTSEKGLFPANFTRPI